MQFSGINFSTVLYVIIFKIFTLTTDLFYIQNTYFLIHDLYDHKNLLIY